MKVEMRTISSIRPYESNPRINDDAVDAVAASIKEFGFRQPIVVDGDGVIVVGHTRYKAAIKLGMTEVPVHVAVGLTPAQAKAFCRRLQALRADILQRTAGVADTLLAARVAGVGRANGGVGAADAGG